MTNAQTPNPHRIALATLAAGVLTVAALAALAGRSADREPPDLEVGWGERTTAAAAVAPLRGAAGDPFTVDLRIRNLGGQAAFAVLLETHSAIGRHGPPRRLQPGPAAGRSLDVPLSLTLAEGMRRVCVSARLQRAGLADADDPDPENNRVCRDVEVARGPVVDGEGGDR